MNIRQLEAFRAFMITRSVTAAADSLGITQPATSRLLAALEENAGFALFKREKRRLQPLPEAAFLNDAIERAFSGLETITQAALDIRNLKTGQLRIACLPGLAVHLMPRLLTEFLAERPQVSVSLQPRSSPKIHEWIADGHFDLGLAEARPGYPGIEVENLTFRCVCIVPKGHPLERKRVITARDLDGLPFIALNRNHMVSGPIQAAFDAVQADWNVRVVTRLFGPACGFVAEGGGVSIVDPLTAADYERWGVVAKEFEPAIPVDISMMYPANRPRSRLVQIFAEAFKSTVAPYQ